MSGSIYFSFFQLIQNKSKNSKRAQHAHVPLVAAVASVVEEGLVVVGAFYSQQQV